MIRALFITVVALIGVAAPAFATPTEVTVRVISQDAKFVGDTVGGARVTLIDVATGAVLASGVTAGTTGDTDRIMRASGRSPQRITEGTAGFHALVEIDRPTLVRVEIEGPLGFPMTMQRAASERWLVPGMAATVGEGWVVELPGLAVRLAGPTLSAVRRRDVVSLAADVQLMCGCPITSGGLWDAAQYEVSAEVRYPDGQRETLQLRFVSAPGRFATDWRPRARGDAEVIVVARNTATGNTGVLASVIAIE